MTPNRILKWESCTNTRDLGGMAALNGNKTRKGVLVRSDTPHNLTANGWSALYAYGIRTVISLRTRGYDEPEHPKVISPYADVQVISFEIEDITDKEFAEQWASSYLWNTPMYYSDALNRWPERHAETLTAIAHAKPGGVLFHCRRGVDRTGIIAMLLLTLVGVSSEDILADYVLSVDPKREEILNEHGTTTHDVLLNTLAGVNVENYLLEGGMTPNDISVLRSRLLTNG